MLTLYAPPGQHISARRPATSESTTVRPVPGNALGSEGIPEYRGAKQRQASQGPDQHSQQSKIDPAVAEVLDAAQRRHRAPNAKGNFCFEATLGYRRVERGR
jgi:hypothetical protein